MRTHSQMFTAFYMYVIFIIHLIHLKTIKAKTLQFEAVFQGICENNQICEQLCFNLHDGTFECDCRNGYLISTNGYSCKKKSVTMIEVLSKLQKQDTILETFLDQQNSYRKKPKDKLFNTFATHRLSGLHSDLNKQQNIFQKLQLNYNEEPGHLLKRYNNVNNINGGSAETSKEDGFSTSLELNSEQQFTTTSPHLSDTENLLRQCLMDCGKGHCQINQNIMRCSCPLGNVGPLCKSGPFVEVPKFHGNSWVAFSPLKEAYQDVQLSFEFNPKSKVGILLVSGENDDLSGDFMAAVLIDGYVEFRWDCGSGSGLVRTPDLVQLNEWNRITVYRHRWDVWLQLNNGSHVQGRSKGIFSRITFREPLYVGGANNLTSLTERLGTTIGFEGCIRKLQINEHIYKFSLELKNISIKVSYQNYHAIDGWDITECSSKICTNMECSPGGECLSFNTVEKNVNPFSQFSRDFTTISSLQLPSLIPVCVCTPGYTGSFCENPVFIEVPSFNGSSFLIFPALRESVLSMLEIEIVFKPISIEGVLLFANHITDGSSDYISIVLSEAHILFIIDLGSGSLTLRSLYPIQPNIWHRIIVSRTARRTWLYVDDQLPVNGASPGAFTQLTLNQPLFIGGLPQFSLPPLPLIGQHNFVGCIQKLALNAQNIYLISEAISGSNIDSCDHPCSEQPCEHESTCIPRGSTYMCKCGPQFIGDHCSHKILDEMKTASFRGRS